MRRKDDNHLKFIRSLPCIKCGNDIETEAAHLRRADARVAKPITGVGIKPDDRFVLPLCGKCHRNGPKSQHEIGEDRFWDTCDPELWSLALYSVSGEYEAGLQIVQAALRFQR
jgi:hypothetical protein